MIVPYGLFEALSSEKLSDEGAARLLHALSYLEKDIQTIKKDNLRSLLEHTHVPRHQDSAFERPPVKDDYHDRWQPNCQVFFNLINLVNLFVKY